MLLFLLLLFLESGYSKIIDNKDLCKNIDCDDTTPVCGIRQEGEGFRLKVFDNECRLLENGCLVDDKEAYGIINMEYCKNSFKTNIIEESSQKSCAELKCPSEDDKKVCALRTDDNGFRLRIFENKCQLRKYNCENEMDFIETDSYMCKGMQDTTTDADEEFNSKNKTYKFQNIIVVDNMINLNNINESIDNFFAATHVFDLPMREVTKDYLGGLDVSGRRMHVRNAGPITVFKPWTTIPKNISTDVWHLPTISSCYHKCPTKCPDTYAPVCGVPGMAAREPNLTFKNHCFMDAAQCKMKWDDNSTTAYSSYYIESSFLFCLGEELNGMYRFLPLVRTLQHMGRLKKKGHFRYKLSNLKFFNKFLSQGNPNFMG